MKGFNMTKKAETEETKPLTGLALLRAPFEPHQISKLPKPTRWQTDELRSNKSTGIKCEVCNGWHHRDVIHLDYVGHAALTDRLLDCDPEWNWEPVATMPDGSPAFDRNGGMWINLTVCGITRLGYGDAPGKKDGNAVKEVIGDALRNAAMRFGAALKLWHKGELHVDDLDEEPTPRDNGNSQQRGNEFDQRNDQRNDQRGGNDRPPAEALADKLNGAIKSAKNLAFLNAIRNDPNFQRDVEKLCKMDEKAGSHVRFTLTETVSRLEYEEGGQ